MTYREILELYEQGKLDEEQKIEIKKELEKQEAIADYLFEHQAPPGMEDIFGDESAFATDPENDSTQRPDDGTDEIAKQINRSIRKAFIKTGVIATIIALILTLFIVFALPHIVSAFYYDPSKSIADDNQYNQIARDMSVYSELQMPEMGPELTVGTDSYGYGNYSYAIDSQFQVQPDSDSVNSISKVYTGNIKRNIVECYNYSDINDLNVKNGYFNDECGEETGLEKMNDADLYYTYVSLDKDIPYEQFFADYVDNDAYGTNGSWVWCGIKVAEEDNSSNHYNQGFYASTFVNKASYEYDENKYPGLIYDTSDANGVKSEEDAVQHFSSMVSYLEDSNKFLDLDEISEDLYFDGDEAGYVSDNGLKVYGFIFISDKGHIDNIVKDKNVKRVIVREAE